MSWDDLHVMSGLLNDGSIEEGLKYYCDNLDPDDMLAIDVFINTLTLVERNFTRNLKPYHDTILEMLTGEQVKVPNYRCALRIARYELLYTENYKHHYQSI